ncbi:MAG: AIR synthase-related protein, partial [Acidimicrobiales bacterium]
RHARGRHAFPLAGSRWAIRRHRRGGVLARFDAASLAPTFDFVIQEISAVCAVGVSDVSAVHDVSGGGIAGALGEMVAVTGVGANVIELESFCELFSEFPGRFIMATRDVEAFERRAALANVPTLRLGQCEGDRLRVGTTIDLAVATITATRRDALERAIVAC